MRERKPFTRNQKIGILGLILTGIGIIVPIIFYFQQKEVLTDEEILTDYAGIKIEGGTNNSVINNRVDGYDFGIQAVSTTNLQVDNNQIRDSR